MSGKEVADLCRLCGVLRSQEPKRNPIRKEHVAHIIKAGLHISVDDDVAGVHPFTHVDWGVILGWQKWLTGL